MESVKGFFESFKEFVWDVIGYLIPGLYLIFLLSVFLNNDYNFSYSEYASDDETSTWKLLLVGYVAGYGIYGFGLLVDKLMGTRSYKKKSENAIVKQEDFIKCKESIVAKLT